MKYIYLGIHFVISMLKKVDSFLLSACTKFSHALQRATGITCYFIAKLGVAIVGICVLVQILNYISPFVGEKTSLLLFLVDFIIVADVYQRSRACTKAEEHVFSGQLTKPRYILQYQITFFRILWLVIAIWDAMTVLFDHRSFLHILYNDSFATGMVIFHYFIAVDPLPPGVSKVREFFRKLFHNPKLAAERT